MARNQPRPLPQDARDPWRLAFHSLPFGSGAKITGGNRCRLLVDHGEFLPALIAGIDGARESVAFQFLNMEGDDGGWPVAEALIRAARRGLPVKGLLDWVSQTFETNGGITIPPFGWRNRRINREERRRTREMFRAIKRAGVEFLHTMPSLNNGYTRNHRKSVVADGRWLWVGGFNPTDHNRLWREAAVTVEGPAALEVLNVFNGAFRETGRAGIPLPDGAIPASGEVSSVGVALHEPRGGDSIRRFMLDAAARATSTIRVENAYLSDPTTLRGLAEAARRGVRVQLVVPARSNHPSVDWKRERQVPKLLKAGVEVYRYPEMTHAKVFSVDDRWISIGSANFTRINLNVERELNLAILDGDGSLAREFRDRFFLPDLEKSERAALA